MTRLVLTRHTSFRGWPAIALARGDLRLHLVPAVGGRIMGIAVGGRELAFQQPERAGVLPRSAERADLGAWRTRLGFPLWGGGKTWLAPESRFPAGAPHPDLDSGAYGVRVLADRPARIAVRLDSPICRDTGLQVTRLVDMAAHRPGWRLVQRALNRGETAWTGGLWEVLMLRRPVRVRWPASRTAVLPGKADPHAGRLAAAGGTVVCDRPAEFKLGAALARGWIAAQQGDLGYLRRFPLFPHAHYPHGGPAEVYNAGRYAYAEVESHGPAVTLAPGEATTLTLFETAGRWHAVARRIPTPAGEATTP